MIGHGARTLLLFAIRVAVFITSVRSRLLFGEGSRGKRNDDQRTNGRRRRRESVKNKCVCIYIYILKARGMKRDNKERIKEIAKIYTYICLIETCI